MKTRIFLFVFILPSLILSQVCGAGAKTKFVPTVRRKMTLRVGETKNIKVKGKKRKAAKFIVKKRSPLVSVSKKGVVRGKKAGSGYANVLYKYKGGKQMYRLTLRVKAKASGKGTAGVPAANPAVSPAAYPTANPTANPAVNPSVNPTGTSAPGVNPPDSLPSTTPSASPSGNVNVPGVEPGETPPVDTPDPTPSGSGGGEDTHIHSPGDWSFIKEPTCIADGIKVRVCTECGETVERTLATGTYLGHEATDWTEVEKDDTHILQQRKCTRCGVLLAEEHIPLDGHVHDGDPYKHWEDMWVTHEETKDSCYYRDCYCKTCDTRYRYEYILPQLREDGTSYPYLSGSHSEWFGDIRHVWGDLDTIQNSSCSQGGYKGMECKYCNAVKKDSIVYLPPIGHTPADHWEAVDENYYVLYCVKDYVGDQFTSSNVIAFRYTDPDGEHTLGDWEITIEATERNWGTRERKCTECGKVMWRETFPYGQDTPDIWGWIEDE